MFDRILTAIRSELWVDLGRALFVGLGSGVMLWVVSLLPHTQLHFNLYLFGVVVFAVFMVVAITQILVAGVIELYLQIRDDD